jgi:flagellar basal body-associated protein FliL
VKLPNVKIIVLAAGLMLAGAGAAVGVTVAFGETLGIGGKPAETRVQYIEKPKVGMMYPLRDRVVNLADPGVMRYLKITVVLELADHSGKEIPKGEAYKKAQEHLKAEMAGTLPLFEDEITTILTSKTSAELMAADGKQRLREEIKARLNKALDKHASHSKDPKAKEEVLSVFFSDFIIQ